MEHLVPMTTCMCCCEEVWSGCVLLGKKRTKFVRQIIVWRGIKVREGETLTMNTKRDKIIQDMEEIIVYIWWSVCLCVNGRISEIVNTGNVDGDVR